MPKLLGQELTRQQASHLESMVRQWRMESKSLYRKMEKGIREQAVRDPTRIMDTLKALKEEAEGRLEAMVAYSRAVKNSAVVDKMMPDVTNTIEKLDAAMTVVDSTIKDETPSSVAAEALYLLYQELKDYRKAVEKFNMMQEVVNMTSDLLSEPDPPKKQELDIVDFRRALTNAHKDGEYQALVARLRRQTRGVRTYTLVRFPIVPISAAMPKATELHRLAEVDPIVLQDKDGKVRTRYLIFRNQLLLAAKSSWLMAKARSSDWSKQDVAQYITDEMMNLVGHVAAIPSTSPAGTAKREKIVRQVLAAEDPAETPLVPGMSFFWFVSARDAPKLFTKTRRIRSWALATI